MTHQETATVLAVVTALAAADADQLRTSELTERAELTPRQIDTVRHVVMELAAQGWANIHGGTDSAHLRWSLGFAPSLLAFAGRQTLAGRAPGALQLRPDPRAGTLGSHAGTAITCALVAALATSPTALGTSELARIAETSGDSALRRLRQLAYAEWATPRERPEGVVWRIGLGFFEVAARRDRFLRSYAALLNAHLTATA